MNNFLQKFVWLGGVFIFSTTSFAASISQLKGTKALIALEGLSVTSGTELFALDSSQKRKAVLRIGTIKGDKAIAEVTQGNATPGMILILKGGSSGAAAPSFTTNPNDSSMRDRELVRGKKYSKGWGILGGMAMSTMAFTAKRGTTQADLALKGNSFNVKGIYDYNMSKAITIRFAGGLETLVVSGSTNTPSLCSDSSTCSIAINYLDFEAMGQFNLTNSGTRVWIGAGFEFLLAASKATTVSNLEISGTNQVITLAGGADIPLGAKSYLPISLEYGIFPLAGVKISALYIRAGWGSRF